MRPWHEMKVDGEKSGKSFLIEIFFFLIFYDKLSTILHLNRLIRSVWIWLACKYIYALGIKTFPCPTMNNLTGPVNYYKNWK